MNAAGYCCDGRKGAAMNEASISCCCRPWEAKMPQERCVHLSNDEGPIE